MLVTQEFTIKVDNETILSDMTLEYGPGVHVIMGPNGVGKSTFAHALMGNPNYETEGAVEFNGKDLLSMETYERARAGLFISFQTPTPIEGLSNFQFIKQAMTSLEKNQSIKENLSSFRQSANDLGLGSEWDKKQLNVEASGGEKKKNELIQMKMLDPAVAILDEPDSGLDVDSINILIDQLKDFNSEDKTIIIVSHYEKLLKSFEPATVTVVANGTTTQTTDTSIVDKVLTDGFRDFT